MCIFVAVNSIKFLFSYVFSMLITWYLALRGILHSVVSCIPWYLAFRGIVLVE